MLIAQRLVRRLHDETKEEYEPDEATRNYVKSVLEDLPEGVEKPDFDNFKLWRPVPSNDVPFGYKGRVVIMEQMLVNENIQKFLRGDVEDIHTEVIEEEAKRSGMLTLLQVGVLAALRGETTLEEISRVI
jgi:type II secretory ATPase GspE/PulE/Tfp pilus assembly ATPase PilB-like protein